MKKEIVLLFFLLLVYFNIDAKPIMFNSIQQLSDSILTKKDTTEEIKIYKLFDWITKNIIYDCEKFKEYEEIYQKNLIRQQKKKKQLPYPVSSVIETINERKGVCDEYSNLFKALCDINNIDCFIINGYAKANERRIGISFRVNHAWNAIKLKDSIFYYDCTWASGYADIECKDFTLEQDFNYYRVPDSIFKFTHLAKPAKFDSNFVKVRNIFNHYPIPVHGFYEYKLYDFYPINGLLEVKKDSVITFKIKANDYLAIASFRLYDMKDSIIKKQNRETILPKLLNGYYVFQYKAELSGYFFLYVTINTRYSLIYKLRVNS